MQTNDDIYILSRKDVFRINSIIVLLNEAIWDLLAAKKINPTKSFDDGDLSAEEQIRHEIDLLRKQLQATNAKLL